MLFSDELRQVDEAFKAQGSEALLQPSGKDDELEDVVLHGGEESVLNVALNPAEGVGLLFVEI